MPTPSIEANAVIGERSFIAAGCYVGPGVVIGDDCEIYPSVVIYSGTTIGRRVIVHAGAVLGSDGFGFVRDEVHGRYVKFPQVGRLVIGDDVEIGANCTIDRGALDETVIGPGTKFDNLVHIGHNCSVGANVVIAAQTGISGSSSVGDDCVLGGQVGMGDHAHIEAGAILGGQSGVLPNKTIRGKGVVFWGTPVKPVREYLKELATLSRLHTARARKIGLAWHVIVVGGHSRSVGKTSVVAGIIAALPEMRWTAVKITQFGHGVCSANGEPCDCETDDHTWAVTEERDRSGESDSSRFLVSGAARSLVGAHSPGNAGRSHAAPAQGTWRARKTPSWNPTA